MDLLSCNNFNETVFTNSLSICKTVDFDTSLELEMCFHNVTEAMNGTPENWLLLVHALC